MSSNRIKVIDYLKTIAIIAVFLYHTGAVTNGYLGVEIFFVISGYLMIKSINRNIQGEGFDPVKYLLKRISSLWPLIAVSSLLSLFVGFFCMLPDDYENLAQSVIASNTFSNNILQAITTRNYWDVVNTYKPLMHMWYVGVLLQSSVFLAIIIWGCIKIGKENAVRNILVYIILVSFILFCFPVFSAADKFYFFPFRLFEITIGCLLPYLSESKILKKTDIIVGNIGLMLIVFMLFSEITISNGIAMLIVIISSCFVIISCETSDGGVGLSEKLYSVITIPGRYSYDVFIWHQVIISFLYYVIFQEFSPLLVLLAIIGTTVFSICSAYLRKKFDFFCKKKVWRTGTACCLAVIGCVLSAYLYMHAGIVRDIPELEISKDNVSRGILSNYVDRPYNWDKDFTDIEKIHVLVFGNSFGRDFANVLYESEYKGDIEISFVYGNDLSNVEERVEQADYIFYGTDNWQTPDSLRDIPYKKLYIVGNKQFGNCNGIIYSNRSKEWYFQQRVNVPYEMLLYNNAFKGIYGEHYVDMISPLINEDNKIRVFTDDNFYISQDCNHLTRQGAIYYSKVLDLSFITK